MSKKILLFLAVLILISGYLLQQTDERTEDGQLPSYAYSDALTYKTYLFAKENPDILSQIKCYCGCDQHSNHETLKECFDSDHASYCDICKGENIKVQNYLAKNKSIQEIRILIDKEYLRS